jgi:hypothetical protein
LTTNIQFDNKDASSNKDDEGLENRIAKTVAFP